MKLVREKYEYKIISDRLNAVWRDTANQASLPILLYHDICEDGQDINTAEAGKRPYILNEYEFEKQMLERIKATIYCKLLI